MPVYEYECAECGVFESWNSIVDRGSCACPECGKDARHVILTAPAMRMHDGDWSAENNGKGRRIGQLEDHSRKPVYFKSRSAVVEHCKKKGIGYEVL